MSRRLRAPWLAAATLLAPLAALAESAEHGGGHGASATTLLWQGINLVALIAVLVYVGRKPIREFFDGRRSEIRGNIDRSAALLADAEARVAEWNGRMARLDAELDEIRRSARERAESERERILADASRSAERIRRDAELAVEQETARARAKLRDEATQLAIELAGDLLRQHVSDTDRRRLADEFIQQIEAPSSASRS